MYCKRQQSVEALHKGGWVKQGTEGGQRAKHATCHMSRTEKVLLLSKRKTRAMKRGLLLGSGLALCPLALQESRALNQRARQMGQGKKKREEREKKEERREWRWGGKKRRGGENRKEKAKRT